MKKLSFSWIIVIVVAFALCAAITTISGSLWFLKALGGGYGSVKHSVGYYHRDLQTIPLAQNVRNYYAPYIPQETDNFNRFVYTKGDKAEYIAGIPQAVHQFSIVRELRQQSWTVRRIGWIIVASRGSNDEDQQGVRAFMRASGNTLLTILLDRLPVRPRVVMQRDNTSGDAEALYIETQGNTFHMVIQRGSAQFVRGTADRMKGQAGKTETLYLALQREILPFLQSAFADAVESKISESMRFKKTQPKILASLLALSPSVYIAAQGDLLAVGVESHDDTIASLIHEWMNLEQGTRHPKAQSFLLPDKTIGYEYIPGQSNVSFPITKGQKNCLLSEGYDEQIFLCGKGSILVFSNEENLGIQLLSSLADNSVLHRGVVQGHALDAVGLAPRFKKIEYVMRGDSIEVWADAQKK